MYILILIGVALSAASISYTITSTSIFGWLRKFISNKLPKLETLIHCPYCLGHYIVAILMYIIETSNYFYYTVVINFTKIYWIDCIITWFALVGLMSLFHFIILLAYKPVAEAKAMRMRIKNQSNRPQNSKKDVGFMAILKDNKNDN